MNFPFQLPQSCFCSESFICCNKRRTKSLFLFGPSVFGCIQVENYVLIVVLKPAVYFFIGTIGYICAAKRRRGLLSPLRFRTTWTKFSGKKIPPGRFFLNIGAVLGTLIIYLVISLTIHTLFFLGMLSCWAFLPEPWVSDSCSG